MANETAQQIDPLSGVTARIFVVVVTVVAVVVAICLSVLNSAETGSSTLLVLAFCFLLAGFGYLVWAAEPYRRQVTRARFCIALTLVVVACILESLSQLRTDTDVRNDWGPIAVALMLMVAGSYRLPREILLRTALVTVIVGAETLLHSETLREPSLVVSVTVAVTLVIGLGVGSAFYASSLISGLTKARLHAAEDRERRDVRDRRNAIETFFGDDIESLRREVLPFFRDVKNRDAITDGDRFRADALSQVLRASLVSSLAVEPLEGVVSAFDDPDGVASGLSDEQRTALRALIAHLLEQPDIDVGTLSLAFGRTDAREGERLTGCLTARFAPDHGHNSGLSPFVGLLQLCFVRVDVEQSAELLSITFAVRG